MTLMMAIQKGWERSPQNEDSKVFWGIEKGNTFVTFDPKGPRVERSNLPAQFYGPKG